MGDQRNLDDPKTKKAKVDNFGMEWRFVGGADDLPDELLETIPSTSTSQSHHGPVTAAVHPSSFPDVSNGLESASFNGQYGIGFGSGPGSGHRGQSVEHARQHPANFSSMDTITPNGPAITNTTQGSSVLEELLTTRPGPSTCGQYFQSHPSQQLLASNSMGPSGSQNRPAVPNHAFRVNEQRTAANAHFSTRPVFDVPSPNGYPAGGHVVRPMANGVSAGHYRHPIKQDQFAPMTGNQVVGIMNGYRLNATGPGNSVVRSSRPPSSNGMIFVNGRMVGPDQYQTMPLNVNHQQQPNCSPQMQHIRMDIPMSSNSQVNLVRPIYSQEIRASMETPQVYPMNTQMVPSGDKRYRLPSADNVGALARNCDPFSPTMNMQPNDHHLGTPPNRLPFSTGNVNAVRSTSVSQVRFPSEVITSTSQTIQSPIPPLSCSSVPYTPSSVLISPSGPGSVQQVPSSDKNGQSSSASQDPEKRKLIQQQLVLLLHALKCQQRERTTERSGCNLPHCTAMKTVLVHMSTCQAGRSCVMPHCSSSRQILAHWRGCSRTDCPVCSPLRQMTDRGGGGGGGGENDYNNGGSISNGHSANLRDQADTVGQSDGRLSRNSVADHNLQCEQSRQSISALQDPPNGPGGSVSSLASNLPAPEVPSVHKEWHRQVAPDWRNHLVSKLVNSIFPSPDPAAMRDKRLRALIEYARRVEKEMFECANDREEYYHLLAEKIYKIKKDLEEKQQNRQQHGQERRSSSSDGAPPSATDALNTFGSFSSQVNESHPSTVNGSSLLSPRDNATVKLEQRTSSCEGNNVFDAVKDEPKSRIVVKEEQNTTHGQQPKSIQNCEKVKPTPSKKVFSPDELQNALLPLWERLETSEDALPFRLPVDPHLLGIPDYFDVIKNPMDLSTIRGKLLEGTYKNPWEFCDDMWLMFENAWMYNRKASKVYKYCTKLSEMFVEEIDPVMRSLGYCCGRRLSFTPLALVCYGQQCTIPRDAVYYCYEDNKSQFDVGFERYTYCKKCFEETPGDSINLGDDPTSKENIIPKENFKMQKNDQVEYEPLIECTECGRQWHKICSLHMEQIYPSGFVCSSCVNEKNKPRPENRFTAKKLSQCKLSQHLEKRVNGFLKNKLPPETPAGEVIIRVLSSSDKEVEVKPLMKNRYCSSGELPDKFPYRAKAIFAFEVIDGVEVCFFGLHVQEYGSNSQPPNHRRVYIAYIDSVHFFTPKIVRTQVYHEILLGYLEYVRRLGYTMAHIWACPPSEGDDYIFHCHPSEQKIPKPKRLQEWYRKMLDRGIVERTVTDYKDIYEFYHKEEPLISATEMPLFEGDYWPNIIEQCIMDVNAEEAERRREAEAQAAAAAGVSADDGEEELDDTPAPGKKRPAQGNKRYKSKAKNAGSKKSKKCGSGTGNDLTDKIMAALEKHREMFFVVRLYSKQTAAALPPIVDPDSHIACDFMDGRDTFLSTARERHWEFSSLRRAKYSTMALCYELHGKFVYTCNTCKDNNAVWHCAECEDFDLCQKCYEKTSHQHSMKSIMVDENALGQDGLVAQNARGRDESAQRYIQTLVHASQCRDANCRLAACRKMKKVVQHVRTCKMWQSNGGGSNACNVCKQVLSLCVFHARHCQETNCMVPLCQNIRRKLAERQAQLKKKREREMMRRINLMSNQMAVPAINGPSTPYNQQPSPIHPIGMSAPQPIMAPPAYPQQPVNPAAVRAARNIEKIAQQQMQVGIGGMPVGSYQNGPMISAVGMQPPMTCMTTIGPGSSHQQPCWTSGGKPVTFNTPYPGASTVTGPSTNEGGINDPRPAETNLIQQQVHSVLQRLKNAKTPEEREAIMKALQSKPQIFAAIIRLKQQPSQQQPHPGQWMNQGQFVQQGQPGQPVQLGHAYGTSTDQYNNVRPHGQFPNSGSLYQALSPQPSRHMLSRPPTPMLQQQHFVQHPQTLEPSSSSREQNKFL